MRPIYDEVVAFRQTRLWSLGLAVLVLLGGTLLAAQAQTAASSQPCPGSTVDLQGADVARRSRAFLSELQTAVSQGDKAQVAAMVSYPVLVIQGGRKTRIKTKAEFLSQYDAIFDAHVRQAIAHQSARCLFGNYQGAMIGDGEVWFSEQPNGTMKIVTVNLTAGSQ
jgi:hypothetical protein